MTHMHERQNFVKRVFCNKKTKIVILGALILLPLLGAAVDRATGRGISGTQLEGYTIGSTGGSRYDVGELTEGVVVRQSFVAPTDRFYSATLRGATWGREDNTGELHVSLLGAGGSQLYQWDIDVAGMENDADITLYTDHLVLINQGELYYLQIEDTGSTDGKAATFFAISEDWYPDGSLEINGVQQQGDLCLKVQGAAGDNSYFGVKLALRCMVGWIVAWIYYCKAFPVRRKRSDK